MHKVHIGEYVTVHTVLEIDKEHGVVRGGTYKVVATAPRNETQVFQIYVDDINSGWIMYPYQCELHYPEVEILHDF